VKYPDLPYKDLDLGDKLWCLTPNMINKVFSLGNKAECKTIDELKTIINKFNVVKMI